MQNLSNLAAENDPTTNAAWRRFLCACFIAICGVRLLLVQKFASAVAYGDDLDGIARRILLPWHNGTLHWSALFAAHNGDHRIFFTRVWEIFWFVVNGSWDPKLVMLAKIPIFAAAATVFIHLFVGSIGRYRWIAAAVLTCLFAFPFAFANAIWAFQSQFDFFFLAAAFGWLALVNGRSILALALAAISILALASGPVLAASYVPFFAAQWYQRKWTAARAGAHVAIAVLIMAVGLASPTSEAAPHVGTMADKAKMLLRLYAWPHSNLGSIIERLPETEHYVPGPLLRIPNAEHSYILRAAEVLHRHPGLVVLFHFACALVVAAPTLLLLIALARRRVSISVATGTLGLAGFAFLMIVATAIARANQVTIGPRFLDHVALAGFGSFAAGLLLVGQNRSRWRWFALWLAFMGSGYVATMAVTMIQLSRRAPAQALTVLQQYYHTQPHDHAAMTAGEQFRRFIVSDDPTQFMSELDTPGLERVLPIEVVNPTAVPGSVARFAFSIGKAGGLIALIGFISMGWVAFRTRRRSADAVRPIQPATSVVRA